MRRPTQAPGLYLHLPFCAAICPYCDFAVTVGGPERRRRFLAALTAEIQLGLPASFPSELPFDTVYLGGGTPSLLELDQIAALLETLRAHLPLVEQPWIALEANPEDVSDAALDGWRRLGVRMLSLGVQSFEADALAFLGRGHDPRASRRSVERALAAGFDTVSVDLIFGLPNAEAASWERELELAVELGPGHLSCYQLTIEPKTVFGVRRRRGELEELSEERQADLYRLTHRRLAAAGFAAYEVSNFAAAPRHRSRHNRKYWDHTPYLGLGPSSHSFDGRRRWWNERGVYGYCRRLAEGVRPIAESEELTPEQLALEELMLGLRTAAGIDLAGFRRRHGVDLLADKRPTVERLEEAGRIRVEDGRLRPTAEGMAVADSLALAFDLEPALARAGEDR